MGKVSAEDSGIFFCKVYNDNPESCLETSYFAFCNKNKKFRGGCT